MEPEEGRYTDFIAVSPTAYLKVVSDTEVTEVSRYLNHCEVFDNISVKQNSKLLCSVS